MAKQQSKLLKLIFSIGLPLAVGFAGGISTSQAISSWYVYLNKPSFSPPNWLFGPVWLLLYILMGVSLYLVWTSKKKNIVAVEIFLIQLLLNYFWSYIFFGLHNIGLAFVEIIALWFSILFVAFKFWKINKTSTYLLVPYLAWVSFATLLNFMLLILNQ